MEYIKQLNPFYKMMFITILFFLIFGFTFSMPSGSNAVIAYSQKGSQGTEVEAVQKTLKDRGLFNSEVILAKKQKKRYCVFKSNRV